jgi:6-pyruvoyltetrahydropterin/6-carboxytetrahydropterin synthase
LLPKRWMNGEWYPVVPVFEEMKEPVFLLDDNPTAENIARLIFEFTLQAGFPIIGVDLWETPSCYASYSG